MLHLVPTVEEAALAVVRAAAARRDRHSGDPTHRKPRADEIAEAAQAIVDAADAVAEPHAAVMPVVWSVVVFDREALTGVTEQPRQGRDGWWLVGLVIDKIARDTFDVWYMPGSRRVGIGRSTPQGVRFSAN